MIEKERKKSERWTRLSSSCSPVWHRAAFLCSLSLTRLNVGTAQQQHHRFAIANTITSFQWQRQGQRQRQKQWQRCDTVLEVHHTNFTCFPLPTPRHEFSPFSFPQPPCEDPVAGADEAEVRITKTLEEVRNAQNIFVQTFIFRQQWIGPWPGCCSEEALTTPQLVSQVSISLKLLNWGPNQIFYLTMYIYQWYAQSYRMLSAFNMRTFSCIGVVVAT